MEFCLEIFLAKADRIGRLFFAVLQLLASISKDRNTERTVAEIARGQSHELRLPVANILGLSELVDLEHCGNAANRELLELIIKSVSQIDQVIRKITAYTSDPTSPS